jgi:hypothetical protein
LYISSKILLLPLQQEAQHHVTPCTRPTAPPPPGQARCPRPGGQASERERASRRACLPRPRPPPTLAGERPHNAGAPPSRSLLVWSLVQAAAGLAAPLAAAPPAYAEHGVFTTDDSRHTTAPWRRQPPPPLHACARGAERAEGPGTAPWRAERSGARAWLPTEASSCGGGWGRGDRRGRVYVGGCQDPGACGAA